jgi:hypothetical protein
MQYIVADWLDLLVLCLDHFDHWPGLTYFAYGMGYRITEV